MSSQSGGTPPDASPRVRIGASVLGARGHICAFFNSHDEEYRVLLPFVREGIDEGHRAFHVVDPSRRAEHRRRLVEGGIDLQAAEERGQIEMRDWADAHLRGGRFKPSNMIDLAGEAIAYARAHGYPLTRFVTHMEWALEAGVTPEELVEYEAAANDTVPRDGDPVICVYDLARWDGQVLVDIIRTHPLVIIGGVLHENPFFAPSDEFLRELRARPDPHART